MRRPIGVSQREDPPREAEEQAPIPDARDAREERAPPRQGDVAAGAGKLEGDLDPRVAAADDEDRGTGRRPRVPVVSAVNLPDGRIDAGGERWHEGRGQEPGGHDDLARLVSSVARRNHVPPIGAVEVLDPHAMLDGRVVVRGVGVEVVRHLVLGRQVIRGKRERHPR